MNRRRVGEDRGSKEKDRCPLTGVVTHDVPQVSLQLLVHALGLAIYLQTVRGHQSISLPYILYSLPSTPTPPCAYIHPLLPLYQHQ
jgi:hypothetical protein